MEQLSDQELADLKLAAPVLRALSAVERLLGGCSG